jgi:hypothetical protein
MELDARHLDLDVDPVEERAGDFGIVFAALGLGAVVVPPGQSLEDVLAGLRCPFAI